ncbi:hypothetical protein [Acetobacter indonesiensis]|jgi:hypothetical protein|uniref:Lysozyme inhibitor LprI N-terminal domain-containing protein n=1 Tax=Acetobacter indonesiensis TaxID=104101 RepID=A0A252AXB6_9PROT|nr:hypothetical protein [Acetobacter indonesiensis]MCG0993955.1 hypothetical protein [Acetobacter indonesiensis]MCI1436947.1 hypothetical protein [Acetobacter indonesiensis]MCI1545673.1 hypothetical protein [Acetobacter indonesiensis]MCI1765163.1 hypothetical protein [Acetobacter indonesiensis]MCP1231592.1 hypothetical protein [Acetobacter indonesiensis]
MSSFSRLLAAGVFAAGVLQSSYSLAAPCGHSSAHEAFAVQALKSELMVTALSCSAQDRYNAFVAKFRSNLLSEEQTLNSYFRTTYGRSAQREHDDYITQLANVQSEKGLSAGTIFCQQRMAMFDEVNALETSEDLSNYTEAKDVTQPASFETCAAPASTSSRPARPARRATRTTRRA